MMFYFYDLETSSGSPWNGRIMQFAGQRTNENLEAIGEPDNLLIKLTDDILPEPDAILVHGITPQKTLETGLTEAEFAAFFHSKISQPDTVFIGFNNIRFDDEFMRQICFRTFYDPYEWHWKDGRGRWDMLDAMRMMRALRPDGLEWPFQDGKPTVNLASLAKENKVAHENAHDALGDVQALLELTRKFKTAQPKLFSYSLSTKDKRVVAKLAESGQPFIYTSGKYSSDFLKTTVVQTLFRHPRREAAIVYDLRHDPTEWLKKSPQELVEHWQVRYGDEKKPLPIKTLQYNRCPAVAPLTVLDEQSKERIGYSDAFENNLKILKDNSGFIKKLQEALDILEKAQQTRLPLDNVDNQLYEGFWSDSDKVEMVQIRQAAPNDLSEVQKTIKNRRLRDMLPLYKARNYPKSLSAEEHALWEAYRRKKLMEGGEKSAVNRVMTRLQQIENERKLSSNDQFLLSELQLYIESIIPEPEETGN